MSHNCNKTGAPGWFATEIKATCSVLLKCGNTGKIGKPATMNPSGSAGVWRIMCCPRFERQIPHVGAFWLPESIFIGTDDGWSMFPKKIKNRLLFCLIRCFASMTQRAKRWAKLRKVERRSMTMWCSSCNLTSSRFGGHQPIQMVINETSPWFFSGLVTKKKEKNQVSSKGSHLISSLNLVWCWPVWNGWAGGR